MGADYGETGAKFSPNPWRIAPHPAGRHATATRPPYRFALDFR
jgi:hypothetical protein